MRKLNPAVHRQDVDLDVPSGNFASKIRCEILREKMSLRAPLPLLTLRVGSDFSFGWISRYLVFGF